MTKQERHAEIDIDAQIAHEWLKAEFARVRESNNRSIGQHLRHSLARIELVKREFLK